VGRMPLTTRFVFASELVANLSPVSVARADERPQVQKSDLSYSLPHTNCRPDDTG